MTNKITVLIFGEKEELYTITVSATEYERIMNDGTSIIKDSLNLWKKFGKYYGLFFDILHELHEKRFPRKPEQQAVDKKY